MRLKVEVAWMSDAIDIQTLRAEVLLLNYDSPDDCIGLHISPPKSEEDRAVAIEMTTAEAEALARLLMIVVRETRLTQDTALSKDR